MFLQIYIIYVNYCFVITEVDMKIATAQNSKPIRKELQAHFKKLLEDGEQPISTKNIFGNTLAEKPELRELFFNEHDLKNQMYIHLHSPHITTREEFDDLLKDLKEHTEYEALDVLIGNIDCLVYSKCNVLNENTIIQMKALHLGNNVDNHCVEHNIFMGAEIRTYHMFDTDTGRKRFLGFSTAYGGVDDTTLCLYLDEKIFRLIQLVIPGVRVYKTFREEISNIHPIKLLSPMRVVHYPIASKGYRELFKFVKHHYGNELPSRCIKYMNLKSI